MYNLIEYNDIYSKPSTSWQYYRDEPVLDTTEIINYFPAYNNNKLQKMLK